MAQLHSIAFEEFSERSAEVLTELRAGHTLKLIQDGDRIAEIVPCAPEPTDEQRKAAWKTMLGIMEKGMDLGGIPLTRDEMHER